MHMTTTTLTEAEREELSIARSLDSTGATIESAVARIVDARLARVEALADQWSRDVGPVTRRHHAQLTAALAVTVTPEPTR